MSKDLIRYDLLVQEALKGVVRKVLVNALREGLPGEHHFYVSFKTGYPGVKISQRLREKHPEDMTVVLQHQFWDLAVTEQGFEVGLSFSGVPEKLVIPFDAVTGFFDPSVQFGLKFETDDSTAEEAAGARPPAPGAGSEPTIMPAPTKLPIQAVKKGGTSKPAVVEKPDKVEKIEKPEKRPEPVKETESASTATGAEVVSLDAFRKKP